MPGVLCRDDTCGNSLVNPLAGSARRFSSPYSLPSDSHRLETPVPLPRLEVESSASFTLESFETADDMGTQVQELANGRSLLAQRNVSLSRSDLMVGRRLSLEPPTSSFRSRSQSQPPAIPHDSDSLGTGEYLAEAALQNILASYMLPSISISQDVSQGDSNVEDPQLTLKPSYSLEPSKSPFKSGKKGGGTSGAYHLSSSPGEDCNELPTDLSDTVESDQGKEKSSVSSKEVIVCPNIHSHHVGQEIANTVYGLPIDTLFTLLFTNSTFMLDLHTARKTYDVEASEWKSDSKNQKLRQVTYTLTLPTNSFGPKVSHVTETQVISSFSKPSEIYTIDSEAANGGIPYADYFYVSNHWCLTKESSTETRLTLYSQVQYKKDLWGFMKNLIDKHAFNGVKSLMSDMNTALLLEVDRLNLKRTKRRRRRAGSKGPDIADPLHQIIPPPGIKSNDIHKSTQIPSRKMTLPSVSAKTTEIPSVKGTVLLFLCLLLAVNAFLYYRLYDLEERVVSNVSFKPLGPDSPLFKLGDVVGDEGLTEEWVHILRQQESLHAEELERWKKAVMEAADHLRKAEESLRNLHASIPSQQASKMQALLQQLQLLQQMHEQKGAVPRERKPPDGSGAERNNEEAPSRPVNTDL